MLAGGSADGCRLLVAARSVAVLAEHAVAAAGHHRRAGRVGRRISTSVTVFDGRRQARLFGGAARIGDVDEATEDLGEHGVERGELVAVAGHGDPCQPVQLGSGARRGDVERRRQPPGPFGSDRDARQVQAVGEPGDYVGDVGDQPVATHSNERAAASSASSRYLSTEPIVSAAASASSTSNPSTSNAATHPIASAIPGAFCTSSVRSRDTAAATWSASDERAAGTCIRMISLARIGPG